MATAVADNNSQSGLSPLYAKASKTRGSAFKQARQELYNMAPEEREQHCPPSLKGKARKTFLSTGKTYTEQMEEAVSQRKAKNGDDTPAGSTKTEGLTPKEMAQELGITPRQFRIFLRSQKLNVGRGKRYSFTEAEAKKLVAQYSQEHADIEE